MTQLSDNARGIVDIMGRLYDDIRAMEMQFGLSMGGGDMRPRVEYFHDAVRAFTRNDGKESDAGGRLSIEMLAYDAACLRYVAAHPLSELKPGAHANLSPKSDIMKTPSVPSATRKPERAEKQKLGELYQQYGVLFAALLKDTADKNYHGRVEELSEEAEQLAQLSHLLELLGQGRGSAQAVGDALRHLDNEAIVTMIDKLLSKERFKNNEMLFEALSALKKLLEKTDKDVKTLENAHLNYVSAQLGLYEQGKDVVKQLAAKGMNLAGRFVENAMQELGSKGRGR